MKNPTIGREEASEIDKSVARLLSEFRGLEPPLNLKMVRGRLRLDMGYYSSKDPSHLQQVIHAIKVSARQLTTDPMLLFRAMKAFDLKALFFADQRRILIDSELPKAKHRWAEGHEIGHSLAWWHKDYLHGDTEIELSPACHATIEAEANYACGQLLFMQRRFVEEAMSRPMCIETIREIAPIFGNTITSTLWRFVETYIGPEPVVAIVSPLQHKLPESFDPKNPCRYVVQSAKFRSQFSKTSERALFNAIVGYCGTRRFGPLGEANLHLTDDNGLQREFRFETFSNTYEALTLAYGVTTGASKKLQIVVSKQ